MKTILNVASSLDGYIAKKNGDSNWVFEADTLHFNNLALKIGCIVIGSTTFKQYENEIYPMKGIMNFVLSNNYIPKRKHKNLMIMNTPKDIIATAKKMNFNKILVVGGGHTNASFLNENLIDEIIIDIHPIVLGSGIKIFEDIETFSLFRLKSVKKLGKNLVIARYVK